MSHADEKLVRLILSEFDQISRKLESEIEVKIQEDRQNNIENTTLEKLERKISKFKERLSQEQNKK